MDKLQKTAFALKFEMQCKLLKADLNIISIHLSITALLKLTLHCSFPLLVSNKIPTWLLSVLDSSASYSRARFAVGVCLGVLIAKV